MCVWYSWSLDTLIFPASRGGREGGRQCQLPEEQPTTSEEPRSRVEEEHLSTAPVHLDLRWSAITVKSSPGVGIFIFLLLLFLAFNMKTLRWHIWTRPGCSYTSRKSTPACCKQKGCDCCCRPEWSINSQLLNHSESLQICSFWKMAATNKKYFSFHEAGREGGLAVQMGSSVCLLWENNHKHCPSAAASCGERTSNAKRYCSDDGECL